MDHAFPHWKKTLYISVVAQVMTSVGFSSIFPFLPLYVADLGSSTGASIELLAGLVFSLQGVTMAVASPIWGTVADRFGRKMMVERALFGGAIILGLMAFARSAEDLVILRAIQGLITGSIAATYALVASQTPREHSGYAMGMLQVANGLGVALGPLLGGLIADLWGYSASFFVTAALLGMAGFLVAFGIREKFVRPPVAKGAGRKGVLSNWRTILTMPGVGQAYGLRFLHHLGQSMLVPILPLFMMTLVSSPAQLNTYTGLVAGVSSGTATISAIYLGRLGDRTGHRRIVILSAVAAALFYLPQSIVNAAWQLLILQGLVGLAIGGLTPSLTALMARYSRPGDEGSVYGLDASIGSGARAVAPMLGAWIALIATQRSVLVATALIFAIMAGFAAFALPKSTPRHINPAAVAELEPD